MGAVVGAVLRVNRQRAGARWQEIVGPLQPLRRIGEGLHGERRFGGGR